MSTTVEAAHRLKLDELRAQYEREGYQVVVKPARPGFPFDLGSYQPDLVARKPDGTGGLIVEVRTSSSRTSVERFQSVAQAVKEHQGWRFLIVSPDDLRVTAEEHLLETWDGLVAKIAEAEQLLGSGLNDAATVFLWAIFEGAMRRLALATGTPVERLPGFKMLNQLYTMGYMSVTEFKAAKEFMLIRNRVAHGFRSDQGPEAVKVFASLLSELVEQWRKEPNDKTEAS